MNRWFFHALTPRGVDDFLEREGPDREKTIDSRPDPGGLTAARVHLEVRLALETLDGNQRAAIPCGEAGFGAAIPA